jgi:signal transduction histidine kinase
MNPPAWISNGQSSPGATVGYAMKTQAMLTRQQRKSLAHSKSGKRMVESQPPNPMVIFVDDEPLLLKSVNRIVRNEPYNKQFAATGWQALEIMRQTRVHVIVSDLKMPEMDGLTLLKKVRRDYPDTVRIILSGQTDINTALESVHAGNVYRYITKPYDERELVQTIRQALDTWQIQEEKRQLQARLAEQNKLLEKRVKERTEQLLAIERQAELGRCAAQIVHNLKNPLQAVIGHIAIVKASLESNTPNMAAIQKNLNFMDKAADNLTRIISGILQHVKNSDHYAHQWTQLNQVIENSLQFFEANDAYKYEVEKEFHLADDLRLIWLNPLHLQQILDNLIKNALDAMQDCRQKRLTITTHSGPNEVIMEVCDTGTGIEPENLPLIFEPDFTTKPPDKGTGLGLASVKTMVESYAGRVEAAPNPPQGTKFIVALPIADPNVA